MASSPSGSGRPWTKPTPERVSDDLAASVGGHPLIARTLARRGILTAGAARAFLDPALYVPADPFDLPDLEVAVERLRLAIERGEQIVVWGDFDADGQTATALLFEALGALGAEVAFHVPGREEGHGLHEAGLERLIAGGARLILTCDTGTTAHAAVAGADDQTACRCVYFLWSQCAWMMPNPIPSMVSQKFRKLGRRVSRRTVAMQTIARGRRTSQ